eukprot:2943238-Ditylum_brightwellii.AAC.1
MTDQCPSRNYREESPKNTEGAAKAFDTLLKGGMDTVNNMEENKEVANKDRSENCWEKPPRS